MEISQTFAAEQKSTRSIPASEQCDTPPPLESGDRLTREEFERRYEAMPDVKRAELINGVVYMGSPVRFRAHGRPHVLLLTWLGTYSALTPGVLCADNATVRLAADSEPQPDALLRLEPEMGGHSRISTDDYVEGAPELLAEIAASSASYDLHDKMEVYLRSGVQEYIVWRVYDDQLDWFALHEDEYIRLVSDESGVIASRVFPGLRLARSALLAGNAAQVVAELRKGLETAEHAAFVARLGDSR